MQHKIQMPVYSGVFGISSTRIGHFMDMIFLGMLTSMMVWVIDLIESSIMACQIYMSGATNGCNFSNETK